MDPLENAQAESVPISRRKNPRIGTLIIPSDPYWVQAMEAIVRANQNIGDELVVLQLPATTRDMEAIPVVDLVDQILAYDLDALVTTYVSNDVASMLVAGGLPVICMGEMDFHHKICTCASSLYQGGKMAGAYLGRKLGGQGHVLCVTGGLEKGLATGQSRLAGFQDGLAPFPGIQINPVPAFWDYDQAYPSLLAALKNYPRRIDGIFGVSDTLILAARDAGRKQGVIDERTVLVGLNGDPMALVAIEEGSLSATIDTASEELGSSAVYLAHKAALGLALPDELIQTFQLITRENVASVATRKLAAIAGIPSQMVGYNRQQELGRLSQLEISIEITRQIGFLQERERVVQVISELLHKYYGYERVRIFRWSKEERKLTLYGSNLSPAARPAAEEQDPLLVQTFENNEVVYIPDITTSRRWHNSTEWESARSRALLPIQAGAEVIGVLDLQSSQPVRQPSLELIGLKLLASQLSIVIQNTDLYLDAVKARETAERANQLKNRLIANVGHEMRTPLNSILGFSQSIQKQIQAAKAHVAEVAAAEAAGAEGIEPAIPTDGLEGDVQHIYQSGEHLMFMINDLLDLSRAEIGALSLYFEPVEPAPFLRELFSSFASAETPAQQVAWTLNMPQKLPIIRADVVRLRQVFSNLLVNAQKFTRQGSITLGAEVTVPHLHVWVSDTGPGVPMELQEKIFEPFSKVIQKRRPEGIGLGLSITRHLVLLHGGMITLESQPGQGSTFHVYLPLPGMAKEPLSGLAPAGARSPDGAVASSGEQLLLVITSQAPLPREIQEMCDRQRLLACPIMNRHDLAGALGKGKPAAVAWDLASASACEWELVQQISSDRDCASLPVILYGMEKGETEITAGLTNVFYKPCNTNLLKDWINQMSAEAGPGFPVLVVDDDPQARRYFVDLLETIHPHSRVLEAENGKQALAILKSETPSLILLDLMMPEMNGFEVLAWIRGEARTKCIPVILISGKLLDYDDIQRLNYFKTIFLTKDILTQDETLAFFQSADDEALSIPQPTSLLVKQALAYLHQNYTHPVSRKDIADQVGVSENYLSQIFRQETTLSPWDYLSRYRIHKAKELLVQTDERVTQIALKVGFNDAAYFCRVFHKMTGYSPQDYRQRGKG